MDREVLVERQRASGHDAGEQARRHGPLSRCALTVAETGPAAGAVAEVQDRVHAHRPPVRGSHARVERRSVERDDVPDVARGIGARPERDLAALHADAAAVERLALEAHVQAAV